MIINVGIFWFYKKNLIAKKIAIKELVADEIGMVDSPFQHIDEWENKHIYLPSFKELIASEYQEFPRGRVVYSEPLNQVTIYMDSSLFTNKYKAKLISYFNIMNCTVSWKKDSHYNVYSY